MSTLIVLTTDDAVPGSSPSDSTFNIPQLSASNLLRYNVKLEQVSFTNVVYPINSTRQNNIFYFQENNDTGTTYSFTIAEDTYTGTEFATYLTTQMNTASGNGYTYTVSYDSSKKKLTFSEATNSPFRIVNGDSSSHREVGWDILTQTSFVVTSTEAAQPVNLAGSLYVDVFSDLSTNNISSTSTGALLYRVPLTASFGEIQFDSALNDRALVLNNDTISSVRFYLRDDRGFPFDIPSHFPVSYTLRLSVD